MFCKKLHCNIIIRLVTINFRSCIPYSVTPCIIVCSKNKIKRFKDTETSETTLNKDTSEKKNRRMRRHDTRQQFNIHLTVERTSEELKGIIMSHARYKAGMAE
jgi:hypothetical protein